MGLFGDLITAVFRGAEDAVCEKMRDDQFKKGNFDAVRNMDSAREYNEKERRLQDRMHDLMSDD